METLNNVDVDAERDDADEDNDEGKRRETENDEVNVDCRNEHIDVSGRTTKRGLRTDESDSRPRRLDLGGENQGMSGRRLSAHSLISSCGSMVECIEEVEMAEATVVVTTPTSSQPSGSQRARLSAALSFTRAKESLRSMRGGAISPVAREGRNQQQQPPADEHMRSSWTAFGRKRPSTQRGGLQGFLWGNYRGQQLLDDNAEASTQTTHHNSPRSPTHVNQALQNGEATYVNRRWIQFLRPGAVQMEGRAPYGSIARQQMLLLQAQQIQRQQFAAQQSDDGVNNNGTSGEAQLSSSTNPRFVPCQAGQQDALPAFVVEEEDEDDQDESSGTVFEGVDVEKIASDQKLKQRFQRTSWMLCIFGLIVAIVVAVVVMVALPRIAIRNDSGGGNNLTNDVVMKNKTNGQPSGRSDLLEFGEEFVTAVENITSPEEFQNPQSAAYRAMQWVAFDHRGKPQWRDPSDPRFLQRYILAVFHFALNQDTCAPWCLHLTHFLSENHDECEWQGIDCVSTSRGMLVSKMNMDASSVLEQTGTLPSELGGLSELESIKLGAKGLTGTIPPELANATKLQTLALVSNNLVGPFPDSFRFHKNLRTIFLWRNHNFGGTIPSVLATLPNLLEIGFTSCGFTGTIPSEIGEATSLRDLFLGHNRLTGNVPNTMTHLDRIEKIDLSNNKLTGHITEEMLGAWPNLKMLHIDNNQFNGTIPSATFEWGSGAPMQSKVVTLSNNFFSGKIPASLATLAPIRALALDGNNFHGTMPPAICDLVNRGEGGMFESLQSLSADCNVNTASPEPPPVQCSCCHSCR